jgi:putative membrane protein
MAALAGMLDGWQAEPVPLALAVVAVSVYAIVRRRSGRRTGADRVRDASFLAGVGVVLIAVESPIDEVALTLQWVHMVQHLLLLMVAPPLVLVAHPAAVVMPLLPAGTRHGLQRLAGVTERSRNPVITAGATVLFVGVLWLWHVPALYNATLASSGVHDLEHALFLAAGLLYWGGVIGAAGVHTRLLGRGAMVLAGMVGSWMLAVYIGYAPTVLYRYTGSGTLPALSDQQIAAGVMWVPGTIPFVAALVALAARWFEADARAAAADRSAAPKALP